MAPQSHGLRKLVPFIIITANRCGVEGLMEEKETKHLTANLLAAVFSAVLSAGNLAQFKYVMNGCGSRIGVGLFHLYPFPNIVSLTPNAEFVYEN